MLCVLMVECLSVVVKVMLYLMSVMNPPPTLCNLSVRTVVKLFTNYYYVCYGCFCFGGELGFLDCNDINMCVVNKRFELLQFVFNSVYVELKYNEISPTFTPGSVYLSGVCSHAVVFGVSVRLSRYRMWVRCLR